MTKFEAIPLYDPKAVMNVWHRLVDGVEKVFSHADIDEDVTKMLNAILAGQKLLWLGFVDGVYAGFAVTSIHTTPTNPPRKFMLVYAAYKNPKIDEDLTGRFFTKFEDYAQQNGCVQIECYSTRKGFERYILKQGFRPTYTRFVKDI
jgi:hypothetical protein